MSTTEEQYAKDFLVQKLGFSEEEADDTIVIGELIAAGSGWGALALAAYELLDDWFSSSSTDHPVDLLLEKLNVMSAQSTAALWGEYVDAAKAATNAIIVAGTRASEYADIPGIDTRQRVSDTLNGLETTLRDVLDGRSIPFMPTIYRDDKGNEMPWVKGRSAPFTIYDIKDYNEKTHQFTGDVYKFQAYRDDVAPLEGEWALPLELRQSSGVPRWDGLLSRKVAVFGLPTWLTVLTLLEPFHQLSGYGRKDITGMRDKTHEFMTKWRNELLSTRDMPTLPQALIGLSPQGWAGTSVWWKGLPLPLGFTTWPCGVLDPITGVEICSAQWWHSDRPEFMTVAQILQFGQLRSDAFQRLLEANGFNAFAQVSHLIDLRLTIPPTSPSLAVHPELLRSTTPVALVPIQKLKHADVTDPGGTVWQGTVHEQSVHVDAPVSVQPNPAPEAPFWRRAVTDTVFGYRITVTPKGGTEQSTPLWQWHLRLEPGASSLYHEIVQDASGAHECLRQPLPYEVVVPIETTATTFVTVTDGKNRQETDPKEDQPVRFTMTIRVCDVPVLDGDRIPFPLSSNVKKQRERDIWINQHGVIWIKIAADAAANNNRSFELQVNVTEISAINKVTGERLNRNDFSSQGALESAAHATTLHLPIPVDIGTIVVPSGYFDWLGRVLAAILHSYTDRKVGPNPDPPEVELSQLRLILTEQPERLRSFAEEYRRTTKRRSLTTEQSLAEIDMVLAGLVSAAAKAPTSLDTATATPAAIVQQPTARQAATATVVDTTGARLSLGAPVALAGRFLKRLTGGR
jgi:hypothetical protein